MIIIAVPVYNENHAFFFWRVPNRKFVKCVDLCSVPDSSMLQPLMSEPEIDELAILADNDVDGLIASTIRALPEGEYRSENTMDLWSHGTPLHR